MVLTALLSFVQRPRCCRASIPGECQRSLSILSCPQLFDSFGGTARPPNCLSVRRNLASVRCGLKTHRGQASRQVPVVAAVLLVRDVWVPAPQPALNHSLLRAVHKQEAPSSRCGPSNGTDPREDSA